MKIEILYIEGCPNFPETVSRVKFVADALGVQADIAEIEVEAGSIPPGFCGSPTVLINGVDIETGATEVDFLCCRTYRTGTGMSGTPSRESIRSALSRR